MAVNAVPIVGAVSTAGSVSVASAQRVVDMDPIIHLLEPDATPLTALSKSLGNSEVTTNPKFNWLEDALQARTSVTDGAAYASGATSIIVQAGDGVKFGIYDLVKVPSTGEIFLVTAITTDTLTVTRAFGTTAAAAIAAVASSLLIIGSAFPENAGQGTLQATQVSNKVNYTQIFRKQFGFSETLAASKLYGGDYKVIQSKKRLIEHLVAIEEQFMFGEPYEATSGTAAQRATGGINYWIQTNVDNINGTLTYAGLVDFAQTVSRYGSMSYRLLLAAPVVVTAIDNMAQQRLFTQTEARVFGVKLNRIQTSHIDFMVKKMRLLSETSFYNDRAYALDVDVIKRRPLEGRDTKLKMNRQNNITDGEIDEYITEVGLEFANEETSGVMVGVTG